MCGIAGIVAADGVKTADLVAMSARLDHRGPDGQGFLVCGPSRAPRVEHDAHALAPDAGNTVGLAHRRLSIIDLSAGNSQPMPDPDGDYALTYNGEIYNYVELRRELASRGHQFRTEGDTEVVLRSYMEWGEDCVQRFIGMWAFAVVDRRRSLLFASRDRFGIKPLFYRRGDRSFHFASELGSLSAVAGADPRPDEAVVARFLLEGRTDDAAATFFAGLSRLPPAHNLTLHLDSPGSIQISRYWTVPDESEEASADPPGELRELLTEAVRLHARSDVPVGTCLSGGLDSSGIVCLADRLRSAGRIPSYAHTAFGYVPTEESISERRYMEAVVAQTDLEMNYVTPGSGAEQAALARVVRDQGEPFGSASILAQWFVFDAARRAGIKVMLDGQGADEILAGYHGYLSVAAAELLQRGRVVEYARFTAAHRRNTGAGVLTQGQAARAALPDSLIGIAGRARRALGRGSADATAARGAAVALRPELSRHWSADVARDGSLHAALAAETTSRSLPALLRYEDRNSMAHSIEARVPFLDHRLAEFAFRLPADWKIRAAEPKYVLRRALGGVVPDLVRSRKDKIGFRADPGITWRLAERHRESLLAARTPYEERWFEPATLAGLLDAGAGDSAAEFSLWRVMSVKLWLRSVWGESEELFA